MIEPTGYTALDLIGFTDKGAYDPTANYVKNDIVTVGNTKWRCKVDDTTGVTPAENANWTIYLESATSLAGMSDVTLTSPKNGDGLVHDGNDWTNIPIMTKEQWKKNGAYNLCPNEAVTQIISGITVTVNSDKSVSIVTTGTNSQQNVVIVDRLLARLKLSAGKYKIVGCPSGGSAATYSVIFVTSNGIVGRDTGDGDVVTLDGQYDVGVAITIAANQTLNLTFKPMITTDLNATPADYVPYAKTNRELTENVMVQKLTATAHATNIDNFSSYLYKIGNLVIGSVNFRLLANSSIGTELFTLGTVPKEYMLSVLSPVGTAQRSMQITINTNGKVLANNAVNADWFTGIFIYKV